MKCNLSTTMNLKQKISLTGYRLLFILQLLASGPMHRDEILSCIEANEHLQAIGPDTLRLDLNTLISAGFDVQTKYFGSEYKYVLSKNPVNISLTQSEVNALNGLKTALTEVCGWRYIVYLYKLFQKLSKHVPDEKHSSELLNFGYFLSVNLDILNALNRHCEEKDEIEILYNSPESGEKTFRARCMEIEYNRETKKLYFWCKLKDYEELSYLRVEKILKILRKCDEKEIELPKLKKCRYKVRRGGDFCPSEGERAVRIEEDFIEVEADVLSEFHFIQKILLLEDTCFWVEDEDLRKKILEKLLEIRKMYGEDE